MQLKNNFVDVILPNFNKGNFIEEAINSIIKQSHKNWKLYIIDDCSSDHSINIISNYEKLKNIFIIKLKKNKGPSFCRNLGVRISSSDYISFIDSDDIWESNKLEHQLKFMIDNKYDFSYSDYTPIIQTKFEKKYLKKTNLKKSFKYNEFLLNSSINTSTSIITRKTIGVLKFKNINKLEDYLFKCQILNKGIIANKVEGNLAYYRILKTSRSSQRIKNLFYLWSINRDYNNLNFFKNMISILMISLNSIKKYGFK
tara:strand:+ start:11 stop:778 length:768 start_codon:yes stop_codon:yes gene_type:complete